MNHVFISYAHLDDKPLPPSTKGWVSNFDEALRNLLSQKLGEDAKVWRDTRMVRNAVFNEEIFDNLSQSATMVSVVTPRYLNSTYCIDELDKFCEQNNLVGAQSRVFKVVKTQVQLAQMPAVFQQINGYDFFKIDEQTEIPREFVLDFGGEWAANFLLKTSDLAYEIAALLTAIEENNFAAEAQAADRAANLAANRNMLPTIYLAHTSRDCEKERDDIRRDLKDRGFTVLPDAAAEPETTAEYQDFVRENLRKCSLAVHLIGKNYGACPEDGERSYIHLQTIVSAERAREPNFTRLVCLPKELNLADARQQNFVREIWNSTADGAEVLEKSLEEIKTNIQEILRGKPQPAEQVKFAPAAKPSVFVSCDKADAESAAEIEKFIKERGFTVWSGAKLFNGETGNLINAQKEYLRNCDAVLIYWNAAQLFWAQIMLQQLQKIWGDGREESFCGEAMFIAANNSAADTSDEIGVDCVRDLAELEIFLGNVKTNFQSKLQNGGRQR